MTTPEELGPLARLEGTWEGNQGLDVAFSHGRGEIFETPYFERTSFSSFGPVDNGRQTLFGLDYRTAAWREGEENPFHTEVGYWLWDADRREVMRCFMVPRGTLVLAGGIADANATVFTMSADLGSQTFGILSNPYLDTAAKTVRYQVEINLATDDVFSYNETTVLEMAGMADLTDHTDRNTLQRTA